jgi:dethiobiotin synthetase
MEINELSTARGIRIAVVGTGTDVGKTHLGVALLHELQRRGCSAVGLKPVESGVPEGQRGSDTSKLAAASSFHVKHPAPYCLPDPVSPHLAARRAGVVVELGPIMDWVAACAAPWTIIETAGGLLSPLARGVTNLDLVAALTPDVVVLVGVDRLGTLHDVAACQLALAKGLPETLNCIVVLHAPGVADASTGTNGAEMVTLGMVDDVVLVPRGEAAASAVARSMALLMDRITACLGSRCFT